MADRVVLATDDGREGDVFRGRLGLTLGEVQRLTRRTWHEFAGAGSYAGSGAYLWVGQQGRGESVYPGKSAHLFRRLVDESRWAVEADYLGFEAFSRLVTRYDASAYFVETTSDEEARDLEALIGAAHVHINGHPPIACGGAWLPRSERGITAWDAALRWAEQEISPDKRK